MKGLHIGLLLLYADLHYCSIILHYIPTFPIWEYDKEKRKKEAKMES